MRETSAVKKQQDWVLKKMLVESPWQEAERLTACGYRAISNRYLIVARIPRGWDTMAAAKGGGVASTKTMEEIRKAQRRALNRNKMTLSHEVYVLVPNASGDDTGFVHTSKCDYCRKEWPTDMLLAEEVPGEENMAVSCPRCQSLLSLPPLF